MRVPGPFRPDLCRASSQERPDDEPTERRRDDRRHDPGYRVIQSALLQSRFRERAKGSRSARGSSGESGSAASSSPEAHPSPIASAATEKPGTNHLGSMSRIVGRAGREPLKLNEPGREPLKLNERGAVLAAEPRSHRRTSLEAALVLALGDSSATRPRLKRFRATAGRARTR